jgi:hypothetical protein
MAKEMTELVKPEYTELYNTLENIKHICEISQMIIRLEAYNLLPIELKLLVNAASVVKPCE